MVYSIKLTRFLGMCPDVWTLDLFVRYNFTARQAADYHNDEKTLTDREWMDPTYWQQMQIQPQSQSQSPHISMAYNMHINYTVSQIK